MHIASIYLCLTQTLVDPLWVVRKNNPGLSNVQEFNGDGDFIVVETQDTKVRTEWHAITFTTTKVLPSSTLDTRQHNATNPEKLNLMENQIENFRIC